MAPAAESGVSLGALSLIPWYASPSLVTLRKEVDSRWPARSRISDGVIGDNRHATTTNSHNPVGAGNGPRVGTRGAVHAMDITAFRTGATAAIASLGYSGRQGEHMHAVQNTPTCHNMVVCTLCSCYPWPVLGLPPTWYKSAPYRSRAVRDPRGVLADFGVVLPAETEIRVWDSTAELRYLVIPQRPVGSENLNEEQLAALVTRDSMIGTGLARSPGAAP